MHPKIVNVAIPAKSSRNLRPKAAGAPAADPLSRPRPFLVHALRLRSRKIER